MIRFISRFNKEEVYAHIHQEINICIKFKLHFKIYLNKTCVAHRLQWKIQGAIYFLFACIFLTIFGKGVYHIHVQHFLSID